MQPTADIGAAAAALQYADLGWRVVPLYEVLQDGQCSCGSPKCGTSAGKHPRIPDWVKQASADEAAVRDWWTRWPAANVGVALGSASGVVAVDVDPPGGEAMLAGMAGADLPPTLECRTGKGRRLLYAIPDSLETDPRQRAFKSADGLEAVRLQGTGGQCVLPPSTHYSGRQYTWVEGRAPGQVKLAPMPGWLLAEMCRPDRPAVADAPAVDAFSPGAVFNNSGNWWRDVLAPCGARRAGGRAGVEYVTRPGKASGTSATLGHYKARDGSPALYVFSGNWPGLDGCKCYDLFGAYARLFHGGDYSAAAADLSRKGYGRPRPDANGAHSRGLANGKKAPTGGPPAGTPDPFADALDLDVLLQMEIPDPQFVVEGIIPSGLVILASRPKVGKSWLVYQAAMAITGEHHCFGKVPTRRRPVLYLALEDTRRRLKDRAKKMLAKLAWEPPKGLTTLNSFPRAGAGGLAALAEWFERNHGGVVIIDTLAKFRDHQKGGGDRYAEDYEVCSQLKRLADLHGGVVIVVTHTRKLVSDDPFDEVSGTLGLTGAADTTMVLERDRSEAAGSLYLTGRDIPEKTITLAWDGAHGLWSIDGEAEGVQRREKPRRESGSEKCRAWLEQFMAGYVWPDSELEEAAKQNEYSPKQFRTAKKILRDRTDGPNLQSQKRGFAGVWWNWIGEKSPVPPDRPEELPG